MQQTQGIELADGVATHMGDGVFAIQQRDERGTVHTVVLSTKDMGRLLRAGRS